MGGHMGESRHHECTNRHNHHFPWNAVQLYHWTRLAICSIAVALAGMTSPAAAQTADACKKLNDELVALGKATPRYEKEKSTLEAAGAAAGTAADKAFQFALDELATKPSPLLVNMGERLSSPGETLVTFEDKRIDALPDASKVCVRAFFWRDGSDKWDDVSLRQVFVSEKSSDKPKRLNVIFDVVQLPSTTRSAKVKYLFVGALADATPAISFSHAETVPVTNKWWALVVALLFVAAFYVLLAIITYNEDTHSVKGPAWLAYTLSPIRISAAWFGEASMSQVQLLVFTFIVAGLLFYHWWTSRVLSELSTNLLMLVGISAVGTGASKFAQNVKTSLNDQTARYLIGKGWYNWDPIPARSHATLRKLLLTDGRLDIYKFQMAIFTVVVACYVISAGQASLVDVKISDTMLYLIGISQGVYVGGKAVTDRTTDLEAAVQKMIDLDSQIRDAEAKLAPGAARPPELAALYDQYAKAAATAAVEFTALQNRKFPTKFDFAKRRVNDLGPQVSALQAKVKGGAELTSDEQALQKEFEQVDVTAKEFAAFKEPDRVLAVQDIKNIDPTVLKP
jgi:hypothetical protein